MENDKSSIEKFIESIFSLLKLALVLVLVWIYIDAWKNAWKNKNWIKFILLSIIPALIIRKNDFYILFIQYHIKILKSLF